ncbi:MAG: CsbD family protein [Bdellovibrionales bacterium]|nr:CsbD family protein [Bdellovibrionales bacterium]
MNQNMLKGKWTEIKGEIQKMWGKVNSNELEETKGDLTKISGLIQQKYGKSKEDFSDKLHEIFNKFEEKKEDKVKDLNDSMRGSH